MHCNSLKLSEIRCKPHFGNAVRLFSVFQIHFIAIDYANSLFAPPDREFFPYLVFLAVVFRYVVEPYRKYPNLLEVLLNFLKNEQSPGIRKEVCISLCSRSTNSKCYSVIHVFVTWTP